MDQAGNLVTVRGEEQTSDDADRPVTLDTSAGSTVFGYDGRGNRTSATNSAGTITYGYDAANRMTTGSDGSVYTFTGDNLRASAQPAGSGPVLDWVWDTASEVPTLLSDGVREFVYGPGGIALSDQPIAGTTGADPAVFLHPDGFGSVRSATNAAGDEVWARSYVGIQFPSALSVRPGFGSLSWVVGWSTPHKPEHSWSGLERGVEGARQDIDGYPTARWQAIGASDLSMPG